MDKHQLEAKEFLSQAYRLDRQIRCKLIQIETLNEMAVKSVAIYSNMPKNPNRTDSWMEYAILEIINLEIEINQDILQLISVKKDIIQRIKSVENFDLQTVLELRYLAYKKWDEISAEMHYGIDNIYRLHRIALSIIAI